MPLTSHDVSIRSRVPIRIVAALALAAVVGCSSNATTTPAAPSGTATGGPGATATPGSSGESEYAIVPDAEVTAGLAKVRQQAADVRAALASSPDDAKAKGVVMKQTWFTFEGTIRQKDKSLYLTMEDAMADITRGADQNKPERVDKGIADLGTAIDAYLKAHP